MSLTKATYSMIGGAAANVLDFGADPTGVSSSVAAFNAAVANGGTVYVPSGTYKINGRIVLTTNDTTLFLAADVTLNMSDVPAEQVPFGAYIVITANNCAVIGSGPSSLLQNTNGTRANTIAMLPGYTKLLIRDLMLDGDKSQVTSEVSDTFEAGIMLIAYAPNTPADIEATLDGLWIRNYAQYGISIYGNQCNGIKIVNCNIRDIGNVSDPLSVGSGIVGAPVGSNFTIANNVIKNCKFHGIFLTTAGVASGNHVIANNIILSCGGSGICYPEQANYASVSGVGIVQVNITGNVCLQCTRSGIQLNVDTVGFLNEFLIAGNICNNNDYAGIEVNCTNTPPNIVSNVVIAGNKTSDNAVAQIAVGANPVNVEGAVRPFTPIIQGSTSAGTATYAAQAGSFIKNGNVVTFNLAVDWSGHTGTGDIRVAGFPYTVKNAEPLAIAYAWANGLTITGQAVLIMGANQTYGSLFAMNNGSTSAVAMDAAAALRISGSYFTDS
jgi:hypothetical protein